MAGLSDMAVVVLRPGVPGALCWFAVDVAASGWLVLGCAVVCMGPAGRFWSL